MVNITHKLNTLRKAIATAVLKVSAQQTIDAIKNKTVPKGDVFEFARAAGLLAAKKTSDVIPDCHPLPIEYAAISYEIHELSVIISVEVHTVYKTGVEVEAMHSAAVTALVMYDMLKPIDKNIEIQNIKLQSKQGGKSSYKNFKNKALKIAVIVCSDTISQGLKEDRSGKKIIEKLQALGLETDRYQIISDDYELIRSTAKNLRDEAFDLAIFSGGTGLSPRDVTPDALASLIDKNIPGIMEQARNYGQDRMPYAMLSRGVAGFIGNTLVLSFPGSEKGVVETMDALFPQVLHVFDVRNGDRH